MINEKLTFGIDLGIASCGWAVLEKDPTKNTPDGETASVILAAGSWMFDAPEDSKTRVPTNQIRRSNRLMRRVIRRRRIRMREIRNLFYLNGLLPSNQLDALKLPGVDPWEQRARGLDQPLTAEEFAVALGHIAKHRGFASAAKRQDSNATSDDKKMLKAMEKTEEMLARYRTVGEMFARDDTFRLRRRNREGIFDRTVSRSDLAHEVKKLFETQRRLQQSFATAELEQQFTNIAFFQRPMQDSVNLVGQCRFEPEEKRCAKFSPSYERFRLLCRLINLRIVQGGQVRKLSPAEIAIVTSEAGKTKKLTFKKLRKLLNLTDNEKFDGITTDNEEHDVVARTGSSAPATKIFRKLLGETSWQNLHNNFEQLDAIAFVISFYETTERIDEKLAELNLAPELYNGVKYGLENNLFSDFKGAGHLSAKACRRLLPFLEEGKRYDEACQCAGYNHSDTSWSNTGQICNKQQLIDVKNEIADAIANPVVRKSFGEAMKQLWAMKNRFGLPGAIHIELARDLGKSVDERRAIEKDIAKRTSQREKDRKAVQELLNLNSVDGTTLLRYQLWKEQCGKCLYSGKPITPLQLISTDNSVQIDHILPWSRFGDDSYHNKTLCLTSENQKKKGRTPFEWFQQDQPQQWEIFLRRIETNSNLHRQKIRHLSLVNAKEKQEKFRSRNLNDTRYASRVFAEAAKLFYPAGERQEKNGKRRVFTRPGALTSSLRGAWGLESLKKVDGKRVDDARHHAIDAIVVAAIGEGEMQRLTRWYQHKERTSERLRIDPPWETFRHDVLEIYQRILVARPERRRARGEGHEAKIKQLRQTNGQLEYFERKAIKDLKLQDLDRMKDRERNSKLFTILKSWVERKEIKDWLEDQKKETEANDSKKQKDGKRVAIIMRDLVDRKALEGVTVADLEILRDGRSNSKLVTILQHWIESGQPLDDLPRSPKGDVITKVRLISNDKPGVDVRGGHAGRGKLVRIDIFSKPNKKGADGWYAVPIYNHQIADKKRYPAPPNQYAVAHKDETDWPMVDGTFTFRFSLYSNSYIRIIEKTGAVIEGYYNNFDRSGARISINAANDSAMKRFGLKTLKSVEKFTVDRFGQLTKVGNEKRTWHGGASISHNQQN